jgi:hypothetical protein
MAPHAVHGRVIASARLQTSAALDSGADPRYFTIRLINL